MKDYNDILDSMANLYTNASEGETEHVEALDKRLCAFFQKYDKNFSMDAWSEGLAWRVMAADTTLLD